MQINWINFDGNLFQKLCNSLILFEVSKHAHVYSAPGKDGGIDQYFEGEYEGKRGKWRFQDKFHSEKLSKAKQISAFKQDIIQDIKNDIKYHTNKENYIVYFTNINLLPQEEEAFIKLTKNEIKNNGGKIVDVLIWHHAKIEALLTLYPLIYYKYWEYGNLLLENYQDYFKSQIDKNNHDLRFQLNNEFYGRTNDLKQLDSFINDTSKSTILITAEGGFGKTRLCIEFFQKFIDENDDWFAFVLIKGISDMSRFIYQFKSNKKYIILIDDAFEFNNPGTINEIKRYADNNINRIKLIITVRESVKDLFYKNIPNYSKGNFFKTINLERLNYEDTYKLFKSQLPNIDGRHLSYLSSHSKGVPNLILELCQTIREGKHPNQVNEHENFISNVKKIVDEAIDYVYSQTYIEKDHINKIIKHVSLLSPILNDNEEFKFLSNLIDIKFEEFCEVISRLKDNKLIAGLQTFSITPDPYSDIVLKNSLSPNVWINEFINKPASAKYISNIIKNLSKIEWDNKSNYSDKLLENFVSNLVDKSIKSNEFSLILDTVKSVADYKPQIAITTINNFINIYSDVNHPLNKFVEFYSTKSFIDEKIDTVNKIFEILFIHTKNPIEISERFKVLENFIKVTNNYKSLTDSFRYREFDFRYPYCGGSFCCVRQQFLKTKAIEYLHSDDMFKQQLGFLSGEILLSNELSSEEYYVPQTYQFHYGRGLVPLCEHTKELRKNIIYAYIESFNSNIINVDLKGKIFNSLLEILRFIRQPEKGRSEYDHSEEIDTVFNFLNNKLDSGLDILLKNKILYELEIVIKKDYKKEYDEQIEITKEKASKLNNLKEELNMLLLGRHIFKPRNYFEEELKKIITKYNNFKKFQEDFIEIRYTIDDIPYYYATETFNVIASDFLSNAKEMFNYFFNNYIHYFYEFRVLIRAFYKDEQYFYNILNRIRDSEIKSKYDHIAWLLTYGRNNDINSLKVRDFEYWDDMIYNHLNEVIDILPHTLLGYIEINKDRTFNMLKYIFDNFEHPRQIEMMILSLTEDNNGYIDKYKNEIKELILNHTQQFPLNNSYFNYAFAFLENNFGFETLFNFLINRIESNENDPNKFYYSSFSGMHYGNSKSSEEDNILRFLKVFKWYIQVEDDIFHFKKNLLEFFKPSFEFDEKIKSQIEILIEENKTNSKSLIKIGSALEIFEKKDENLISTLIKISDYYLETPNNDVNNLEDIFGFDILTGPSSTSKHQPGPFPQDVERKELLEKIISGYNMKPETRLILEKGRKNTQQRIDIEILEAKNNW